MLSLFLQPAACLVSFIAIMKDIFFSLYLEGYSAPLILSCVHEAQGFLSEVSLWLLLMLYLTFILITMATLLSLL